MCLPVPKGFSKEELLFALDPKERHFLAELLSLRYLTFEQATRLSELTTDQLEQLEKKGFLRFLADAQVLGLTPFGHNVAEELVGVRIPIRRKALAILFLPHLLMMNEAYILLQVAVRSGQLSAFTWLFEAEGAIFFRGFLTEKSQERLVPDATLILRNRVYYLEMDRGTMAKKAIHLKLLRYQEYFRHSGKQGKVLFLCENEHRADQVQDWLKEAGVGGAAIRLDDFCSFIQGLF